jgi:hypothetical protein
VSVRYDAYLTEAARRSGVPVVAARPFDTVVARVEAALADQPDGISAFE